MKAIFYLIVYFLSMGTAFSNLSFNNGKAGFTIVINGEINPYKVYSIFLMPGTRYKISSEATLKVRDGSDKITPDPSGKYDLVAPAKPGISTVSIEDQNRNQMQINVLTLTPLSGLKNEYLNGYRIGNYPSRPLNGNPIYNKPQGLFEVTEKNQDMKLTPHFTLSQFICKQVSDFPKYLIIRERLLLKLEYLLELLNERGSETETFGFISGYRTPYYNAQIKNVQYSRHVYGGAADVFIDQNGDGSMDDLNKDGRIDEKDVKIFFDLVDGEYNKLRYEKFRGGLGFYRRNNRHNGFIHVDVRGWKARW